MCCTQGRSGARAGGSATVPMGWRSQPVGQAASARAGAVSARGKSGTQARESPNRTVRALMLVLLGVGRAS
jgi:hypothetical protein